MGRKKKRKQTKTIKSDLLGGILVVLSLVFIVFLTFDNIGVLSDVIKNILKGSLGVASYIIPAVLMLVGIYSIMSDKKVNVTE